MRGEKMFQFPVINRPRCYIDWDKVLDGGVYQLEAGTDYTCRQETVRRQAQRQARDRGKTVRFGKDQDGNLVIQAEAASPAQLELWRQHDQHRQQRGTSHETGP
jgi:hypothetical protein